MVTMAWQAMLALLMIVGSMVVFDFIASHWGVDTTGDRGNPPPPDRFK